MPRQLAEREDGTRLTADDEPRDGDYPTVVVCSGEFIEQVRFAPSQLCNFLTLGRYRIRTTRAKLSSFSDKVRQPPCNIWPGLLALSTCIKYPLISRLRKTRRDPLSR